MSNLSKTLGQNLRTIRKRLHRTQERFCEASGLPQSTLSRLEAGIGYTMLERLGEAIAQAGGDPLDLLHIDEAVADDRIAEIRRMLLQVDDATVNYILKTLRREVLLAEQLRASQGGA